MELLQRYRIPKFGLIIIALCIIGGMAGWYHTIRLRMYVWRTERVVAQLEQERHELIARVRQLSAHPLMREKQAREGLQLGYEGETVYRTDR